MINPKIIDLNQRTPAQNSEINHSEISPSTMKSPDVTEISNNYPGEESNTTTNNIDDMTTDEQNMLETNIP